MIYPYHYQCLSDKFPVFVSLQFCSLFVERDLNFTKLAMILAKNQLFSIKMCMQRLMVRVGQIPVVKDGIAFLFPHKKTDQNICCFFFQKGQNFGNKNPDFLKLNERSHLNLKPASPVHLLLPSPLSSCWQQYCNTCNCTSVGSTKVSLLFSCFILSLIIPQTFSDYSLFMQSI